MNALSRKKMPSGSCGSELAVRDFGPIAEGKIDLRPLTVFAGPSNTGKSWMATLIYSVGRYLSGLPLCFRYYGIVEGIQEERASKARYSAPGVAPELRVPENPREWLNSISNHGLINLTASELKQLHSAIQSSEEDQGLVPEFLRCRGLHSAADMARAHSSKGMFADFRMGLIRGHIEKSAASIDLPSQVSLLEEQARHFARNLNVLISQDLPGSSAYINALLSEFMEAMLSNNTAVDSPNGGKFLYLPAGRGALANALHTVTSGLIWRESRRGSLPDDTTPGLNGVVGDFLHLLQETANRAESSAAKADIAHNLESEILRGKVKVERSKAGVPKFSFQPIGWKGKHIPLMSTSSMVSELASVALFLRYWVNPGDTLIIEEPEAHLHPSAQVRFVEDIATWLKAGIRVIVTTHSEWILATLSNMVIRSKAEESDGEDKPSLAEEDVGVWLFDFISHDKPGKGTRIVEIPWEDYEGGYEAGFYASAIEGVNDWYDARERIADESQRT